MFPLTQLEERQEFSQCSLVVPNRLFVVVQNHVFIFLEETLPCSIDFRLDQFLYFFLVHLHLSNYQIVDFPALEVLWVELAPDVQVLHVLSRVSDRIPKQAAMDEVVPSLRPIHNSLALFLLLLNGLQLVNSNLAEPGFDQIEAQRHFSFEEDHLS